MNSQYQPAFDCQIEILDVPGLRRRIYDLKRGWCAGKSENTVRSRHVDLRDFASFVLARPVAKPSRREHIRAATVVLGLLRVGASHTESVVCQFIDERRESHAPSTIIRRIKTLRSWAHYLHMRRAAPCSLDAMPIPEPAALVASETTATAPDVTLEEVDVNRLHPEAKIRAQGFIATRNQTITSLLEHSSLDRPRLLHLDWGALELPPQEEGTSIPVPARVQVRGRDGRPLWRHLGHRATRIVKHWSRVYASRFGATLPDRPVFVGLSGERLSQTRFYEVADRDKRREPEVAASKNGDEQGRVLTST